MLWGSPLVGLLGGARPAFGGRPGPLPAGLGNFEIRPASELIDNHSLGDIKDVFMIPMHKEEALWINFDSLSFGDWPCLVQFGFVTFVASHGEQEPLRPPSRRRFPCRGR